jgi:hypothetical protein
MHEGDEKERKFLVAKNGNFIYLFIVYAISLDLLALVCFYDGWGVEIFYTEQS